VSGEASVKERKKILSKALAMASGTLVSRILGLLRDVALAALFERAVTDAWTAAFRLPNFFRRLLGEGSLSVSFIPVFIEAQSEDPHGERARNLVNALYAFLLVLLAAITLWGVLFPEPLLGLILSKTFQLNVAKWAMTVRMARIMFGFAFFVCQYAFFMGLLNALGSFALPALAPAMLNVSMLVFTFLPTSWFAQYGDGLAWGVLVGGFLQAMILWFALRAKNYLPRFQWNLHNRDLQQVLRRVVPGLVGLGVVQFSNLVTLHFASRLQEGAISSIYWADRLLELPISLIAVSMGTALLPTLSEYASGRHDKKFSATLRESFLMNLYLIVPAVVGLFFLSENLIEVIFLRGHFTLADLRVTSLVLKISAVSLLFISMNRVLVQAYYARKKTTLPALVSVGGLAVHFVLAALWSQQYGLRGLVSAGVVGFLVQSLLLIWRLHQMHADIFSQNFFRDFLKITLAAAAMAGFLFLRFLMPVNVFSLALLVAGGAALYLIVAHFVGLRYFKELLYRK
jgi:putative peptidoglycan lipid II flippase